jgi:hypothetical protein
LVPVAETIYVPGETDGTLKLALIAPEVSVETVATLAVPKLMLIDSPDLNPAPLRFIVVPSVPCAGFSHMVGLENEVVEPVCVTVNVAVDETPASLVAVTVYVPGDTFGT